MTADSHMSAEHEVAVAGASAGDGNAVAEDAVAEEAVAESAVPESAVPERAVAENAVAENADVKKGATSPAGDATDTSRADGGKSVRKRRGKARASESALHEAEEFAASVDADLASGDDDGADDDELSAAGPDSSELVAGPRDIDD
jgi:hypothetical protein